MNKQKQFVSQCQTNTDEKDEEATNLLFVHFFHIFETMKNKLKNVDEMRSRNCTINTDFLIYCFARMPSTH